MSDSVKYYDDLVKEEVDPEYDAWLVKGGAYVTISRKRKEYVFNDIKAVRLGKRLHGETLTVNQLKSKVHKTRVDGGKCFVCECTILFKNYYVQCSYQWTLDRIDDTLCHTESNTRTNICLSCNNFLGGVQSGLKPGEKKDFKLRRSSCNNCPPALGHNKIEYNKSVTIVGRQYVVDGAVVPIAKPERKLRPTRMVRKRTARKSMRRPAKTPMKRVWRPVKKAEDK